MEAATHEQHHHHELPTSGRALTNIAISATLHCLTGCAIGEVAGMAIGTALGFSNCAPSRSRSLLAFVFGYSLTSLPLLRAGLRAERGGPDRARLGHAEHRHDGDRRQRDRLAIPGAMHAGLGDLLFWGALAFALAVAFVVRRSGQPLAARARQGPRRGPQHGDPRRASGQGGRRRRRAGVRVRLERPHRRGDQRRG